MDKRIEVIAIERVLQSHRMKRILAGGRVPPTELCLGFPQVLIYAGLCLKVLLSIIDLTHFLK